MRCSANHLALSPVNLIPGPSNGKSMTDGSITEKKSPFWVQFSLSVAQKENPIPKQSLPSRHSFRHTLESGDC